MYRLLWIKQIWKFQVGDLKKGINPSSLKNLDFDPNYISAPIQAGLVTAMIALAVSSNYYLFYEK